MQLLEAWGKNFMSFRDFRVVLKNLGLTQLTGWNYDDKSASGAGKTALFDIVPFVLFCESPRKLKANEFINDQAKKNCEGGLLFLLNDGRKLKVVRTRKPEDLYYQYDDEEPKREENVRATNKKIEEILKFDMNTFQNSVYFSRSSSSKFIEADDAEKRKILTRILDLSVYDKAYDEAKNKEKYCSDALEEQKKGKFTLEDQIEEIEEEIDNLKDKRDSFHDDIQKEVDKNKLEAKLIKGKIDELEETNEELNNQIENFHTTSVINLPPEPDFTSIDEEIQALLKKNYPKLEFDQKKIEAVKKLDTVKENLNETKLALTDLDRQIVDAQKDKLGFEQLKGECSVCKQDIDEAHKEEHINALNKKIKHLKGKYETHAEAKGKYENLEKKIIGFQKEMIEHSNQCEEIKREEQNDANKLVQLERQKKDLQRNYELDVAAVKQKLAKQKDEIEIKRRRIELNKEQIESKKEDIKKIITKIKEAKEKENPFTHLIAPKEEKSKKLTDELIELSKVVDSLSREMEAAAILKTSYKNVKFYIFESTIDELNRRIGKYLDPLFHEDVKLHFSYDSGKNTDKFKFQCKITKNGIEKSYNSLSDGEKRRCELACNFAMSDIVSLRKGTGLSLMMLDEVFDGLPEECRERVVLLLEVLAKDKETIMIIDHFGAIGNLIDNNIHVNKRNKESQIAA